MTGVMLLNRSVDTLENTPRCPLFIRHVFAWGVVFMAMGAAAIRRIQNASVCRRGKHKCSLHNAWSAHSCAPSRHCPETSAQTLEKKGRLRRGFCRQRRSPQGTPVARAETFVIQDVTGAVSKTKWHWPLRLRGALSSARLERVLFYEMKATRAAWTAAMGQILPAS